MFKLIPLYYQENLLSDEIFEEGTCSLKGQRSPNKHLIKYMLVRINLTNHNNEPYTLDYHMYTNYVIGDTYHKF